MNKRQRDEDGNEEAGLDGDPEGSGGQAHPADGVALGCVDPFPAVRLRGLPFNASAKQVIEFAGVCPVDVIFQSRAGRPNGTAFVLCSSRPDQEAVMAKHHKSIGTRYIEVFPCSRMSYYRAAAEEAVEAAGVWGGGGRGVDGGMGGLRQTHGPNGAHGGRPFQDVGPNGMSMARPVASPAFRRGSGAGDNRGGMGGPPMQVPRMATQDGAGAAVTAGRAGAQRMVSRVLKLQGLPYEASPGDVAQWVSEECWNLGIKLNEVISGEDVVVATNNGASIGIAFVELQRPEDAESVMHLNRRYFGRRYIEICMSSSQELRRVTGCSVA